MRLLRKLTRKEWKEIGEKYKDGGVHMYRGKRTLFYKGEKLFDGDLLHPLIYDEEERQSWEVIIILPGVEVIPDSTFWCCKDDVKTVLMSDTVKRIGKEAFIDCDSIVYIKLSRNLEYIGEMAFQECSSLASIFIPPSCRGIHQAAFGGCEKLIIFHVPQHTRLDERVIADTSLIYISPFHNMYNNHNEVNDWIKTRHNDFPLTKLCCSEDPIFNQSTIILTREECCRQAR